MGSFEEILVKKHLKRTKARVMILKVLEKRLIGHFVLFL